MRVDVFADRFGVEVTDVIAACELLHIEAKDPTSEFDEVAFTEAVKAIEHQREDAELAYIATPARPHRLFVASMAAAVAITVAVGGLLVARLDRSPGGTAESPSLVAYRTELQAAYESTVGELPAATDYRALADELSALTPPAALKAEHAQLITEAQNVAELAASTEDCTELDCADEAVAAALDPAAAADALNGHVEQIVGDQPK